MFAGPDLGSLVEPLTGRRWDRADVLCQYRTRVAYLERLGLAPGDRVFLHHGSTLEFFVDLVAVWALGGCAIPIDERLTDFEIGTLARAARPRLSLWRGRGDEAGARVMAALGTTVAETLSDARTGVPGWRAAGKPGRMPVLDQDALILFTSGTTGRPKGVVHTHRSLRARWMALRQALGLGAFRRTLCLLPTHFGHGLICNALYPWLSGQDLYILPPARPEVLMRLGQLVDEHGVTFLSSVPTMWRIVLKTAGPPEGRTLERVFCGSAPLSAFLWKEIRRWTGTPEVWNAYGITETGSWVAGTSLAGFEPGDGLVGEPWGADLRILRTADPSLPPGLAEECRPGEEGYVWLNTPALMRGYLDRDDLTHAVVSQGWFVTGDLGVRDERGRFYLRGREREEINKGGTKVHPADVDAVVEQFGRTKDVCTFGYEDPLYGEDVGIAVVLEDAGGDVVRELLDWTKRRLAEHKVPRRWYVLEAIPRTARGKLSRADVSRTCAALSFVSP